MVEINEILKERGERYGDFADVSSLSQRLKAEIRLCKSNKMPSYNEESLDMICNKIARIVCGDPDYRDSWDDIAGYAKLSADRCTK